ncbi:MAG TPA: ATP-binding cassette domain-containing protein [Thermoanaerobaculia bacterium]|nr:ATP-binding cassette domain-containing protein [Thermoanaerobaculia bacterium]
MQEALYQVRGLVKRYARRAVLDRVDFDVLRGESLVILGRSGSGKSVTLRQLNGLEKPDAGTVTFDGQLISEMEERELFPVRRRIAMLFQGGALFDSMPVFDNVAFPLREHSGLGEPEIAQKVREKLEMVKLKGVESKMPADLSGGMKKRVALARSLALEPEVMLFDEPTTGLDPMTSATIGKLMRSIQQELGVTAVVVTHDLQLGREVGDRVGFLTRGRFAFLGGWEQADGTRHPEFAAFLAGREEDEDAA